MRWKQSQMWQWFNKWELTLLSVGTLHKSTATEILLRNLHSLPIPFLLNPVLFLFLKCYRGRDMVDIRLADTSFIREAENICIWHIRDEWKILYLDPLKPHWKIPQAHRFVRFVFEKIGSCLSVYYRHNPPPNKYSEVPHNWWDTFTWPSQWKDRKLSMLCLFLAFLLPPESAC